MSTEDDVTRKRQRYELVEEERVSMILRTTESMLPRSGTVWHVIFQNPDLFLSLIKIASPVLTDRIRFYPTVRKGFTGILIDEFAPSQSALMIGRLCCPVHIADVTSGKKDSDEIAITVSTEALLSTLKGTSAIQSVAMYQRHDSANVFFAILDPSTGHVLHDDIPTLTGTRHSTLKALTFRYQFTVNVEKFKRDLDHVAAKGIADVTMRLSRVNPGLFLLILSGTSERGTTFASLPISTVPTLERSSAAASSSVEMCTEDSAEMMVRKVGQLKAETYGKQIMDPTAVQGVIPYCKEDIDLLEVCYQNKFTLKSLEKMIKSLKDESQMTLFLSNAEVVMPLIIRFDIDIKHGVESYAAFVLAPKIEES